MDQPESSLETARRYVAQGEANCTELTKMLEGMEAQNPSPATQAVERLLTVMDRAVAMMREHVQQEEELLKKGSAAT